MKPVMTIEELNIFLADVFPQIDREFTILDVGENSAKVQLNVKNKHLRPGGTVSGPSMFALADVAIYIATLAKIGPEALAVTTNCSIDFMRKPANTNLIAEARLLKTGKTLVVGDVMLFSQGSDKPVAHANLTYAIPPARK